MDGFICYHQTSYHNLLEMTSNCRWGGDGVGVGGGGGGCLMASGH